MNMFKCSTGTLALALCVAGLMVGCTSVADGDPVEINPGTVPGKSSNSNATGSSSSTDKGSLEEDFLGELDSLIDFVEIPASKLSRGSTVYSVSSFDMATTEVTQGLYRKVVGEVPVMDKTGDNVAVANVTWYEAVLFCNAFSKILELDTAYVYDFIGVGNSLENLTIDYSVESIRLPTETEWEIAARAGTTSTYYWDVASASKYAYYGQTSGPVKVAGYIPNGYGLYDMGGNVAEWINDWYGSYSTKSEKNPTGAISGEYKVVRGGGWSEKATAMASSERDKKLPDTHTQMIGFRIVHSVGF